MQAYKGDASCFSAFVNQLRFRLRKFFTVHKKSFYLVQVFSLEPNKKNSLDLSQTQAGKDC
jgi:hypothetical protein